MAEQVKALRFFCARREGGPSYGTHQVERTGTGFRGGFGNGAADSPLDNSEDLSTV